MTYRPRRTKAEMDQIRAGIYIVAEADHPVTVRQVFYRLVSAGVIDKTENEYKSTVVRLLTEMRLAGELPYGWIADNTRWMRKPTTWNSVEDLLNHTAKTYRRNLWAEGDARVEIWLEKEALAGVLTEETYEWDVPLMVTRGYPSLSYIREAAEAIAVAWIHDGKTTHLYYFGDHDPSGVDIRRHVEISLADHICEILLNEYLRRAREMGEDGKDYYLKVFTILPLGVRGWTSDDTSFALLSKGVEPESDEWVELMDSISEVFTFTKVAVTPEQIDEWNLITRPTKKTDSRSANFEGESVEVDAIPPQTLRELARDCITQHVDQHHLNVTLAAEKSEREILERMAKGAVA